jgi:hypothetical protein
MKKRLMSIGVLVSCCLFLSAFPQEQQEDDITRAAKISGVNPQIPQVIAAAASNGSFGTTGGIGTVTHFGLSTDKAITRFLGAAGNTIQSSGVILDDSNNLSGVNNLRLSSSGNYVGLSAPVGLGVTYGFSLPPHPPLPGEYLKATSATTTDWIAGTFSGDVQTVYVSLGGSDIVGDGSLGSPYRTVKKAIEIANGVATLANPMCISVGSGIFDTEDNSAGPIEITCSGLMIVGAGWDITRFIPTMPTNDFFLFPEVFCGKTFI